MAERARGWLDAAARVRWMRAALHLARCAADEGETPVGCVVVRDGRLLSVGYNRVRGGQAISAGAGRGLSGPSPLLHAEMVALAAACRTLGTRYLDDCALVVTMEPCPMCAGAILQARVPVVVYGARDPLCGACGGVLNLFSEGFPAKPSLYGGVLEAECAGLLSAFYAAVRAGRISN